MTTRRPARDFGTVPSSDEVRILKQLQKPAVGGAFCEQCGQVLDPHSTTRTRRLHRTGACVSTRTNREEPLK